MDDKTAAPMTDEQIEELADKMPSVGDNSDYIASVGMVIDFARAIESRAAALQQEDGPVRMLDTGSYGPNSMRPQTQAERFIAAPIVATQQYLQGYDDALSHAAMYVRDHCQQGEDHAEAIYGMKRPAAAPQQAIEAAPAKVRDFLTWWTSIETDERKALFWDATARPEALHSLLRKAYEAGTQEPAAVPDEREDMIDAVSKALRKAFNFGQTYWQQADSDSYSQNKKSEETSKKFEALVDEVRSALASAPAQPTVPDIAEMVNRFLGWPLPETFSPDCGISFKALGYPNGWPVGTNLFTAVEAKAMFEHCLAAAAPGNAPD